jgi:cytochrome P450
VRAVRAFIPPRRITALGGLTSFARDPLGLVARCAQRGDAVPLWIGPRRCLFINHPELIRQAAVVERRSLVRGYSALLLRTVLGNGLLVSEGAFWERQRRAIRPAVASPAVRYGPAIGDAVERTLRSWREHADRELHEDMRRLTLDVAARAVLGVGPPDDGERLDPALEVAVAGEMFSMFALVPALRWLPTPVSRRARRGQQLIDALVYRAIDRADASDATVLGSLLSAGRSMTDVELRDELVTLLFTAYDTTASSLCWTLFLLARHPEIEERLHTHASARSLEWVVRESLRLYPPVPIQSRDVVTACVIGDQVVPAGTTILWSQWVMHRDPRWFDRPDEFIPDRWADGLADRLPTFAYFPFGGGRRNCVGEDAGLTIVSRVVAEVVARARITVDPGYHPRPTAVVTLRPRDGMPVHVEVRSESEPAKTLGGSDRDAVDRR